MPQDYVCWMRYYVDAAVLDARVLDAGVLDVAVLDSGRITGH